MEFSCYQRSMELVMENDCHSIAFPLISAGIYGYPKEEAADVAIKTVKEFNNDRINVIFVCFEDKDYEIYTRKLNQ